MVIVSPWARPGYTDSKEASFASMLAFVEHTLVPILWSTDATAYDYAQELRLLAAPDSRRLSLAIQPVPESTLRWVAEHPSDPDDPT